jgi:hypothetical protein
VDSGQGDAKRGVIETMPVAMNPFIGTSSLWFQQRNRLLMVPAINGRDLSGKSLTCEEQIFS